MPKLKTLVSKIKSFKENYKKEVDEFEQELDEANNALDGKGTPKKKVVEKGKKLAERSIEDSFETMRDQVRDALSAKFSFRKEGFDYSETPYIRYMFPDAVIMELDDENYEVAYGFDDSGNLILGEKVKVSQDFTKVNESLKEAGISITKKSKGQEDFQDPNFRSLKEAQYDGDTGELKNVIFIEAGTNMEKRRHYSVDVVESAAPGFTGLKMFMNHPTKTEDRERPERNIKDWASTITECSACDGKAVGTVSVHDVWLKEALKEQAFRDNIGLSINMGGLISYGKVGGQEVQIVEKIVPQRQNGPASVDWVTEAGARGRIPRLLESKRKDKHMELTEATFSDLKKENPDLVKSIVESVKQELSQSEESQKKEHELSESKKELDQYKMKDRLNEQKEVVTGILKESKLPEEAKSKIQAEFSESLRDGDLKESVNARVASELEYLNKLSKDGKITLAESKETPSETHLQESQSALEKRMGIKEAKKDED